MRITDGSCLRSEPSTLYARIVDGSRSKGRTIHAGGRYHGRFNIEGEPSTLYARIMEGSYLKHEPSHEAPRADEVCDGGISRRAENSEAPACGDGAHGAPSPVMGAGGGKNQNRGRLSEKYTSASATPDRALQNAPSSCVVSTFRTAWGGLWRKSEKTIAPCHR